jgi:hypothetical protein
MTYQLKVIKDYPIGFWPLDESSGTTASDISGCGNNATYVGSPAANMLPIIPGGGSGTKDNKYCLYNSTNIKRLLWIICFKRARQQILFRQ